MGILWYWTKAKSFAFVVHFPALNVFMYGDLVGSASHTDSEVYCSIGDMIIRVVVTSPIKSAVTVWYARHLQRVQPHRSDGTPCCESVEIRLRGKCKLDHKWTCPCALAAWRCLPGIQDANRSPSGWVHEVRSRISTHAIIYLPVWTEWISIRRRRCKLITIIISNMWMFYSLIHKGQCDALTP